MTDGARMRGEAYLAENAARDGVTTTATGVIGAHETLVFEIELI